MNTLVKIDVETSAEGHRAVVYFDGKMVTQTQPFKTKEEAEQWVQHLGKIGLEVPGAAPIGNA